MRKLFTKLCAMMMVIAIAIPGLAISAKESVSTVSAAKISETNVEQDFAGKTVILHTNDVHGAIEGYAYVKAVRTLLERRGAEVILIDCGDFSQGSVYVSNDSGKSAVTMMNATGYDIVTVGNHEFDYGYAQLKKTLKKAKFKVVCADIFGADGKTAFKPNTIWLTKAGLSIGFFGLDTPETLTKSHPAKIQGLTITQGEDLYKIAQEQADILGANADLVICLAHLGVDEEAAPNTSLDVFNNTKGIDLIIDGHSHTVMTEGVAGEPIQSTGTKFANIGMIVIDDTSKKIESQAMISVEQLKILLPADKTVAKQASKIIKNVDKKYGTVFAKTEVDLNGEKAPGNRTEETNLADLVTDSMLWEVTKEDAGLLVDRDHIVCIMNGGGIRASIPAGDITMSDIKTVLPFGNTVSVVYVKGSELLEALEASTFCTPEAIGGFPQVAGIEYTINTKKAFAQGEQYANSTYYAPKKIKRVTIKSINGKAFNKKDVYAVVTNDFVTSGGDTYAVFGKATSKFDTGIPLDEALSDYISNALNGVIGTEYAKPQGRITVK